jgi:uncharacterized protein YdaU (DUF1376 family)
LHIMEYWTAGGLPTDDRELARIIGMSPGEWKKAKPRVQPFFTPDWKHGRIDKELARSAELSSKRAAAAKQKGSNSSAIAQQLDTHAGATSPSHPLDKIGSAGASNLTEGSKALASALWKALGFGSPLEIPPELAGVDWRALEWERAGWTEDLISAECRRVGPGKPLTYYEKVFATSFAKRQAPLPIVEVRSAEKLTVTNHGKPESAIIQAARDLRRQLASFDGPAGEGDELRGGEGGIAPRLLSNG